MLGVVLWSDNSDNKAVIWCEDQGDLAYFNGGKDMPLEMADLDAGDLVRFELQQKKHLRYARNPQRIEQGAYDGLAEQLQDVTKPRQAKSVTAVSRRSMGSADVIPFAGGKVARSDRELVAV